MYYHISDENGNQENANNFWKIMMPNNNYSQIDSQQLFDTVILIKMDDGR